MILTNHVNIFENGIIVLLISVFWIFLIKKIPYDMEKESSKEDNAPWPNKYFKLYDKIYSYPVFIILFASGISLIYNGLALNYGWPVFLRFLFEK